MTGGRTRVVFGETLCLPARSPASRSLAEGRRFGEGRAAPSVVQFNRPNRNNFFPLLPRNVAQTMMFRIPTLRKENYPEKDSPKSRVEGKPSGHETGGSHRGVEGLTPQPISVSIQNIFCV